MADDKWTELKAELQGFAIFKSFGWLIQKLFGAMIEKQKDNLTQHLGSIFINMPYETISIFEVSMAELVEAGKFPEHDRYVQRLCEMPREISNAYRMQVVQGALITLEKEKEKLTVANITNRVKQEITYHAALPDEMWKAKLHYMDLDRSLIPKNLAEDNEKTRQEVKVWKGHTVLAKWGFAAVLLISLLILLAAAII